MEGCIYGQILYSTYLVHLGSIEFLNNYQKGRFTKMFKTKRNPQTKNYFGSFFSCYLRTFRYNRCLSSKSHEFNDQFLFITKYLERGGSPIPSMGYVRSHQYNYKYCKSTTIFFHALKNSFIYCKYSKPTITTQHDRSKFDNSDNFTWRKLYSNLNHFHHYSWNILRIESRVAKPIFWEAMNRCK